MPSALQYVLGQFIIAVKTSACIHVNSDKKTSRFVVFEADNVVKVSKSKLLANCRLNNSAASQLDSTLLVIRGRLYISLMILLVIRGRLYISHITGHKRQALHQSNDITSYKRQVSYQSY